MERSKCIQIFLNENIYLGVSYDFSKFEKSKKIKMWCP
jgi:regulatory protein YycI of two-component signal transduction system YycFG